MKLVKLKRDILYKYFKVYCSDKKLLLKYKRGRNTILVNNPFVFNEDCARLAGLMPDGSLIKDLMRIYFHQKKDNSKVFFI